MVLQTTQKFEARRALNQLGESFLLMAKSIEQAGDPFCASTLLRSFNIHAVASDLGHESDKESKCLSRQANNIRIYYCLELDQIVFFSFFPLCVCVCVCKSFIAVAGMIKRGRTGVSLMQFHARIMNG